MVGSHIQAPDAQDVEDALRALNQLGIRQGRAPGTTEETDRNDPLDFGSDLAPSIVPRDQNEEISTEELVSDKPSLGKRFVGAIIGSIIVAIIATFAWQAYSDDQIKAWWPSIHSKELKPSSDLAANVALQSSNQITAAPPSAPTPVVAETPPELLQQLQAILSDLAALRHAVEEMASKQDQASRDIASLQTAQQNISEQISSLARATSIRAAAQKNAPKFPHSQAPNQTTAAVPVSAHVPPPARPPLPVPPTSQSPAN